MDAAFELAVRQGDAQAVGRLLLDGQDANARDRHGQTALMLAAHAGHLPVVEALIEAGADLDVTAKFGLSAAMLAVVAGHDAIARRLARAGCDLTITGTGAPGFAGLTAAGLAAARDDRSLASDLAPVALRPMTPGDWPAVAAIYEEGVRDRVATFETTVPGWPAWDANHLDAPRLVATLDSRVVGWAALSPVSTRQAYAGVAEVSVYVAGNARGRGVGGRLLRRLVQESEARGLWTLQASIFAHNTASIRLHERRGFRLVGRRERIGRLDGDWIDTVLLERRVKG